MKKERQDSCTTVLSLRRSAKRRLRKSRAAFTYVALLWENTIDTHRLMPTATNTPPINRGVLAGRPTSQAIGTENSRQQPPT